MKKEVMLSSSLRGQQMKLLREAAKDGIEGAKLAVSACEPWPALTFDTMEASLDLVRDADFYLLVIAGRYGTPVGNGDERSFTELEFDEATAQPDLRRLAFFQEPLVVDTLGSPKEQAEQVRRLLEFREKVEASGITPMRFAEVEDLRREVGRALLTALLNDHEGVNRRFDSARLTQDRFYAVHEYSLLDTKLAGRSPQIQQLSQWATSDKPIMVVESFGGFGKSALTWWWWQQQSETEDWQRGFWFSFYEPNATIHEFFVQLHSHLSEEPLEKSRTRPGAELVVETLRQCRKHRHLIVLDGFERLLPIMDGIDANTEKRDQKPAAVKKTSPSTREQLRGLRSIHNREFADWLVHIANDSDARLLITTRYMPSNLETVTSKCRRGVEKISLDGLTLAEAEEYWALLGLDPEDRGLQRLVTGVHGHPLTLEVMAGTLHASVSASLADFFARRPNFPIFEQAVKKRRDGRDDVFEDALDNMEGKARFLLETIALWPVPAPLQDLNLLTCRGEDDEDDTEKQFATSEEFVDAILGLEERRLISRNANNATDMHPVMRDVVRQRTAPTTRHKADEQIVDVFTQQSYLKHVRTIEDIAAPIQLTLSALRINRSEAALDSYRNYVKDQLLRLNHRKIHADILAEFFNKLEDADGNVEIEWKGSVPYVVVSPTVVDWRAYLIKKGVPQHLCHEWYGRWRLAQDAAHVNESLGNYAVAAAYYQEHNRTCGEPFCRTMQADCFEQQGQFGYAARILHECLEGLNLAEISRYERGRLACELFDDCLGRGRVTEARLALARLIKLMRKWPGEVRIENTIARGVGALNEMLAKLAGREGHTKESVEIARTAVQMARDDDNRGEELSAMRVLARCLHGDGQFGEALNAWDSVLSLDLDRDHSGNLEDKARRARDLVHLNEPAAAAREFDAVLDRTRETACRTYAQTLIYRAELDRATNDVLGERKALKLALDVYSKYPGAPVDSWGVRTCIARLRALNAITDGEIAARRFRDPFEWPRKTLAGTDEARIKAGDEAFPLTPIWSLTEA